MRRPMAPRRTKNISAVVCVFTLRNRGGHDMKRQLNKEIKPIPFNVSVENKIFLKKSVLDSDCF